MQSNGENYLGSPPTATNGQALTCYDYSDIEQYSYTRWIFEAYTGDGIDGTTNQNFANTLITGETYDYDICMYSSTIRRNGPVTYSVRNEDNTATDKATINADTGVLTAIKPGVIEIGVTYANAPYIWWRSITIINERITGPYYVQNIGTQRYIDVEGPSKSAGANMQQWNFHTGNSEKWYFEYISGEGEYFRIKSVYSDLYIGVDSSNTSLIKQYSTKNNYTLWKQETTASGNTKLVCKANESTGKALAVPLNANSNGTDLTQISYTDDTNYRDEWNLYIINYSATVNNFYDKGYSVRYNESESDSIQLIGGYSLAVVERYVQLLGLLIQAPGAQYFCSDIDSCKGVVDDSNINTLCSHSGTLHTDRTAVISNFKEEHTGNDLVTNVLWSGHSIVSVATNGELNYNRSCSSGTCIFIFKILDSNERDVYSKGVLMHELNHQYGAQDHYHELADSTNPDSCKHKEFCSRCGNNPRPDSCIMYNSKIDVTVDSVICDGCFEDIVMHLELHH